MNRFVFLKWALPLAVLHACRTATERALPPDGGAAAGGVSIVAVQYVASVDNAGAETAGAICNDGSGSPPRCEDDCAK